MGKGIKGQNSLFTPSPTGGSVKSDISLDERNFKASLKKLNLITQDDEKCARIRALLISELESNVVDPVTKLGLDKSLCLLKIIFEYHTSPVGGEESALNPTHDPFFRIILEPILPKIFLHLNLHVFTHCETSAAEISTCDSAAAYSHELTCLIHRSVRITLSLLKRLSTVNDSSQQLDLQVFEEHLKEMEIKFRGLMELEGLELPLDIKCNLGLGICYIVKIISGDVTLLGVENIETLLSSIRGSCSVNQIALIFGLLTVNPINDSNFETRMGWIGGYVLQLDHGSREALNLGSARVLETWMEKLVQSSITPSITISSLFPDLEFFIFNYIPGHIDAVKICCRNILKGLTLLYGRMEPPTQSFRIKTLLEGVLLQPQHVKWIALSCITLASPKSTCVLEIDPRISESLLCCDKTARNVANDSYLALMNHNFNQVAIEKWEDTWMEPLFATQKLSKAETNWAQKRAIASSVLKSSDPSIVEVMINYIVRKMKNVAVSDCTESSLLAVEAIKLSSELHTQIQIVKSEGDDGNYFRGIVPRKVMQGWAFSSSFQIRLACFSLLVETKKTSELITPSDFESLKLILKYSFVSQNPAFRQNFFAYFKKLIRRFRDSRNALIRKRDTENLGHYSAFGRWLWNFLTEEEGMFPGSNFPRRCQSLECLSELLGNFDAKTLQISLPSNENLVYFRWIFDTYEHNKKLVFPILQKLYIQPLNDNNLGLKLLEASFRLCESVHPPDSVTGRYLGLFLIQTTHNGCPWIRIDELLNRILDKLSGVLDMIKESSLIEVSSRTQMYGFFRFIRMIFSECKGFTRNSYCVYRLLTNRLFRLCLDYNSILLPVLGDAAPEGFLPGLPDSEPQSSNVVRSINAQRLLVCSWRSMRDICLLLSEVVGVVAIEGESPEYVITCDQVKVIGDHLLFLLKNVMHRGVFEQIFTGFKQLAYRLFKSSSRELSALPERWLSAALDEELISTKCITRRSAGLPFIFQALLSPVANDEMFITKYVDRLFEQYINYGSSNVRIHCTNVLRGLFKDANFSRAIMPYVPKGIQLAFDQLKSTNWNECNAGLMLFGAIIRRTFGGKLSLMTAPTFFRKFPEMYDFLLKELKKCAVRVKEIVIQPTYWKADDFTYQVLLLLSSFAVTGVVEYGPLTLSEFIPSIHACGASPDEQVREIAAKALIPFLVQAKSRRDFILKLLESIRNDVGKKSLNEIHGDLLQVLQVLKSLPEEDSKVTVIERFKSTFSPKNPFWTFTCPMLFETLAEICIRLGQPVDSVHSHLQAVYYVVFIPVTNRLTFPGLPNADKALATAQIRFTLQSTAHLHPTVYEWLQNKPLDFLVQLFTALPSNFLNGETLSTLYEDLAVFDIALRRYTLEEFQYSAQTKEEESFLNFLAKIPPVLYETWAELPDSLTIFPQVFKKLLLICQMEAGTVESKKLALIVLGKLALQTDTALTDLEKEGLSELMAIWCNANSDMDLRLAVANCIPSLPFQKIQIFSISQQCKIWFAILTLMMDDEEGVRNELHMKLVNSATIGPFCDRKSIELVLMLFLQDLGKYHIVEALLVIVGLILRDDFDIPFTEAEDSEEDHLFDRSEMNAYAEPILLAKLFREALLRDDKQANAFRFHFNSTPLSSKLVELYGFIANRQVSPTEGEMPTLAALTAHPTEPFQKESLNSLDASVEKDFMENYRHEFVASLLSS